MLDFKDAIGERPGQETTFYNKIVSNIQFVAYIAWPKEHSYVDTPFQSYLLSPQRLGRSNGQWVRDMQRKFVGHVTKEEADLFLMTLGYYWSDSNVSDYEIKRNRKYTHKEIQFPEIDPYKNLYELADSQDENSFWLELEGCQQNRSEATW